MADGWDPAQYDRFAAERRQPFHDLMTLLLPIAGGRAIDLGCGTGELTLSLHTRLAARETLGVDRSPAMLADSGRFANGGLTFQVADIADVVEAGATGTRFDVVFANASLHWVPEHERLLEAMTAMLAAGGQLAFQVPANFDHPSHTIAAEVAGSPRFRDDLAGGREPTAPGVLAVEEYASALDRLGYADQHVRLQVYGHRMAATADVVEWVKGSTLTPYRERLDPARYEEFVDCYRARLLERLGDQRPYFYPFKRILCWARRP